jgi:membrane protease YdiL (CAAX protease family)
MEAPFREIPVGMRGPFVLTVLLLCCGTIYLFFRRARARAAFAEDAFPNPARRAAAALLLAAVLLLTVVVPFAGGIFGVEPAGPSNPSFLSLFGVHAILAVFLVLYYLLSGRRSLADFLRLRSAHPESDLGAGVAIGGGVWLLNLVLALLLVGGRALFSGAPSAEKEALGPTVSPMIVWLVNQPIAVRVAIVVSAMFMEEFFFRAFLQTRIGPLAATLLFTAAHGAYRQPLLLLWILVISTVLSAALALYRNVLPCIVAHGVFDAIQLFVVIPFVLKALPV